MPECSVPDGAAGTRLDAWLGQSLPALSRARWQALVRDGHVRVDGRPRKPGYLLRGGERVAYRVPPAEPVDLRPEAIPLDILFEDAHLVAINKPPGMVVHPAPGHPAGTVVHALLHHCGDLAGVGGELRPGIVHRLDKDTSGVLVAAKTGPALAALQAQFKARSLAKQYLAVVRGCPFPPRGTVDAPIGRCPSNRKKMAAHAPRGRPALSHYRVVEPFAGAALVEVAIETGRTHQIRVHLALLGHPVLGDPLYGGRHPASLPRPPRQALHAASLRLLHPHTGAPLELHAPLPGDLLRLLGQLRTTETGGRGSGR